MFLYIFIDSSRHSNICECDVERWLSIYENLKFVYTSYQIFNNILYSLIFRRLSIESIYGLYREASRGFALLIVPSTSIPGLKQFIHNRLKKHTIILLKNSLIFPPSNTIKANFRFRKMPSFSFINGGLLVSTQGY